MVSDITIPDLPPDEASERNPAPVLLIMPDPEAKVDLAAPLLGRPIAERMTEAALAAGFARVVAAPGLRCAPGHAIEASFGDPLDAPALVVSEGTMVDEALLSLMVAHPLELDEHFTLYDEVGRPAAWFSGGLAAVPALMPIGEEIDWPESIGPRSVARVVYAEDVQRAELLVLRGQRLFGLTPDAPLSRWHREVSLRTLRPLTTTRLNVAQLELIALLVALAAGPLVLLPFRVALIAAGVCLLAGVHVARLLHAARRLRHAEADHLRASPSAAPDGSESLGEASESPAWIPGEALSGAARPLSHAVVTAGLTFVLVAQNEGVAGLVLLAMGGTAIFLSLAHARALLRRPRDAREGSGGEGVDVLAIPGIAGLGRRLGVEPFTWLQGAPVLEILILAATLTTVVAVPWAVLVLAAASRLWRWFVLGQGPGLLRAPAGTRVST